jgi:hypothetical protein
MGKEIEPTWVNSFPLFPARPPESEMRLLTLVFRAQRNITSGYFQYLLPLPMTPENQCQALQYVVV